MKPLDRHDKSFKRRTLFTVGGIILTQTILLTHLFILQVKEQKSYQVMSEDNRLHYISVPPTRGLIYDRNGFALARNRTVYHLEVTPILVEDMERTLTELQRIVSLSSSDMQQFKHRLTKHKPFQRVRLKSKLSNVEMAEFAVNRHRFTGVDVSGGLDRIYPYDDNFSHVIGYLRHPDADDLKKLGRSERYIHQFGKSGLERTHEEKLRGNFGFRKVEVNAEGRILRTVSEKKPVVGKDILLTLDKNLQTAAHDALGDYEGAVVALDPRNGEILAMVSKPAFSPNQLISGIDAKTYKKLLLSYEGVFFNRALSGQYAPGSTIKPIIALAGLKHQITTEDYYMFAGPHYVVPGYTRQFRDWREEGHGWVNLRDSITQSCDIFFYDLSYRLGIDRMSTFFREFGMGALTGIDISNEMPGLVPSRNWKLAEHRQSWYPEETVITGIGQGYLLATPLQLAMITATIANRGIKVQPHLLKASRNNRSQHWQTSPPTVLGKVDIADQYWDYIIDSMIAVVHRPNGTAYSMGYSAPYVMAGKTGTAQVYGIGEDDAEYDNETIDKHLRDHALFIAFAPIEEPTIAIAVVVEHAGNGSKYAAPIARRVLDTHFGVIETASIP